MEKTTNFDFDKLCEPVINDNAAVVLTKRYLNKDPQGNTIETFKEMFFRIAKAIASQEKNYPNSSVSVEKLTKVFYELMISWKFLPNSPTLMNAGTDINQLAACFVLPIGDSMEEIFDAVKFAALIHKSGGGTGFSFSRLREQDSRVGTTGGVASGPLSFLKIFNTATEQVKQGGTRRGANMGILRVDHPNILEFIRAKETEGELNNFNLSVGLTEAFMHAVENDEEYDLISPYSKTVICSLRAKDVFASLVDKAWKSGDPGIIFLDRINKDNPTPKQGEIESTNPCGEQPLLPYEACNLGSINLAKFYDTNEKDSINWNELKETIHLAVHFLDNVIDACKYPLDIIDETVRKNRKIGLGLMGFADLLFLLEMGYDSKEAVKLAEKIMEFIQIESRVASIKLATERGAFPAYEESIYPELGIAPIRNATTTTIAPTGTLSIIAGCSSGIEPLFALSFARHVMDNSRLVEVNPYFEQVLKDIHLNTPEILEEVANCGSIQNIEIIPENIRKTFVTAMDISGMWHLDMQAAFQKYTDNAVSKTVNLPNNATSQDIYDTYWKAYTSGCKGVTVYRDGCLSTQVLQTGNAEKNAQDAENITTNVFPTRRTRPDVLTGFTQKIDTGLGALYLTINETVDGTPFEVFATIGKSGASITAKAEAIGRLVSLALRNGIEVTQIVNQLEGIGGEHPRFAKKRLLQSIPDAVAHILRTRYMNEEGYSAGHSFVQDTCPECGNTLHYIEGCNLCQSCGYSKCG